MQKFVGIHNKNATSAQFKTQKLCLYIKFNSHCEYLVAGQEYLVKIIIVS